MADHDHGHGGLTNLDPQLQEFAVDARGPHSGFSRLNRRINSLTYRGTCGRPVVAAWIFKSKTAERLVGANDDGVRLDHDDAVQAARPQMIEPDPNILVEPVQPRSGRPIALEHQQLMAKSNELEIARPCLEGLEGRRRAAERRLYASVNAIREHSESVGSPRRM